MGGKSCTIFWKEFLFLTLLKLFLTLSEIQREYTEIENILKGGSILNLTVCDLK